MSIVIEKANLRFSRSQFDIMENYKPFITKGFVSLIGVKTSLQSIKLKFKFGTLPALLFFLKH
jgi:hypothetical protein